MNIKVTKDNVVILQNSDTPHENEYKITTCYFTFDDFTNSFQVKRAIFTILSTEEMYETDIINDKCDIPVEVLKHEYETVKLGVYGFNTETVDEEEVLKERFSPSYAEFVVPTGSYEEGALSPEPITPTQYDLYSQALQEGLDEVDSKIDEIVETVDDKLNEVDGKIQEVDNLNIEAEKVGKITTIEITYKDGTTKEVTLEDGMGLDYQWVGTSLGIKREDEQEYVYINLKGEKGDAGAIKMIIVQELPQTGQEDTIYLVPLEEPESQENRYAEYVYIDNKWELLGKIGIEVDLTDYVKNTDYATTTKGGVIKANDYYAFNVTDGGTPYLTAITYQTYVNNKDNNVFIGKGTLENVITGKGLVSNNDYANSSTGGVIKVQSTDGFSISNNGDLRGSVVSYTTYQSAGGGLNISKGTLDNVLNATIGDINTVLDTINGEVI